MWVFGYGSLVWEGWEVKFAGKGYERARLDNYHRSFNKKSTRNWGTPQNPGPTLGLEPQQGSQCVGTAFKFPHEQCQEIKAFLREREGPSYELKSLTVPVVGRE